MFDATDLAAFQLEYPLVWCGSQSSRETELDFAAAALRSAHGAWEALLIELASCRS